MDSHEGRADNVGKALEIRASTAVAMHILMMTAIGIAALCVFVVAAAMIDKARAGRTIDGASLFIWVWLVAALANAYNGWANHVIPLVNEIAAFVPIFGIPAAAAWYWSRRTFAGGNA